MRYFKIISIDYNKNWSDMRGFLIILQYNDFNQISDADLMTIAQSMGDSPVHPLDGNIEYINYQNTLFINVKNIIQSSYGFSDPNMESW